MTTPTPPNDPGPLPLPDESLVRNPENFERPIATWAATVRTAVQILRALLVPGGLLGAGGRLEQSYVLPPDGKIPASDLAPGAVQSNVLGTPSNKITTKTYRNAGLTTNTYQLSRADFDTSAAIVGDENYATD